MNPILQLLTLLARLMPRPVNRWTPDLIHQRRMQDPNFHQQMGLRDQGLPYTMPPLPFDPNQLPSFQNDPWGRLNQDTAGYGTDR